MRASLALVALGLAALAAAPAGADPVPPEILAFAFAFETPVATAFAGDVVPFRNLDIAPHTVTSGVDGADGAFNVFVGGSGPLGGGRVGTFTAPEPGVYPFFCDLHPWMRGVLIVAPAP